MAVEKEFIIDVKFPQEGIDNFNKSVEESKTDIEKLTDSILKLNDSIENTGKEGVEASKDISKASDSATKSTKGIGAAFRGVGTAIKAAGIGLVIAAFATIKDLVSENQKVLDFFNTTFNVVSIAFSDFVNFITDNWATATESVTDFFSVQGIKDFGNALKQGVIDRFYQLVEASVVLGQAFAKLFKGDFSGALDTAKEAGKQFFDVITGEDGAYEQISEGIKSVGNSISNYTSELIDAAKAQTALGNAAAIAQVKNQGLIEQNDRLAEQQRQIRDDTRKSIDERIKANEKLKEILDQQEKDLLKNNELAIRLARLEVEKNNNIENQIALQEALNEKDAIQAQITGFRAEQLTNEAALQQELNDLSLTAEEGANRRAIQEAQFNVERIEGEALRLEALKEAINLEEELETERLNNQIALYKEGTQARVDAEQELYDFQADISQRRTELNDTEVEVEKRIAAQKIDIASKTLGLVTGLLDENSKAGKAAGIAQATINTWQGITEVWKTPSTFPEPFATINKIASTALVAASGFNAVKQIKSTSLSGGGGGSFSSGGGSAPSTSSPNFNVVGAGGQNQIAQLLAGQPPQKAYVVASEVSSQQALDRNILKSATL